MLMAIRPALGAVLLAWGSAALAAAANAEADLPFWRQRFEHEVERRLEVPPAERQRYLDTLDAALAAAGLAELPPQAVMLVDRSVRVQAAFALVRTAEGGWYWLGAAPVSTGRTGSFDHFRTPLGVFAHSLDNLDFRAEGTYNENHIRGYGLRGMRVFDFGWVVAERGWAGGGRSPMRLQMHATDPDTLEPRLGRAESKGCIRIPAALNVFVDRHGLLDADYEQALARGEALWMLRADRQPVPWPGRYLVVIESQRAERPAWAALSGPRAKARAAPAVPAGPGRP